MKGDATFDPGRRSPQADAAHDTADSTDKGVSRRDLFAAGAAAGVGMLAMAAGSRSAAARNAEIGWDDEADVVVLGAGCTGLPAAIRAHDLRRFW